MCSYLSFLSKVLFFEYLYHLDLCSLCCFIHLKRLSRLPHFILIQSYLIFEFPSLNAAIQFFNFYLLPINFLGVVTQSPLRLELEFEPVPTNTWFLMQTFIYSNQITFTGQKTKQDVVYDHLK